MDINNENQITVEEVAEILDELWKQGKFMRSRELHESGDYEYMSKEGVYANGRTKDFISYKKYMKLQNWHGEQNRTHIRVLP